jgi:hypothetical protein
MRRKRLIALAVLPALLVVGDFFYWRLAVNQLRSGFDTWVMTAHAAGWAVRHGKVSAGGWPDSATLRVENLTVTTSGSFGGGLIVGAPRLDDMEWGSDTVLLRSGLTQPDTLEVIPSGLHPLRFNTGPPIPISADHMRLRLVLRSHKPPRTVEMDADGLAASVPKFGQVTVGHLSVHADPRPDAERDQVAITFSMSVQPVILPDSVHWSLGNEIGEIAVEGVLNGHLPLTGQGAAARAISWRDEGGSLELHRLLIEWGRAKLDATATMALDEDLQPMGAGTGKISGYGTVLDMLMENGTLTRSAATAAKAVLSLLAGTPGDDQTEEVEVPLTLQFRTLSVRQVPLLRLPELDWPER